MHSLVVYQSIIQIIVIKLAEKIRREQLKFEIDIEKIR